MKPVLIWCLFCAVFIVVGLLFKPAAPIVATGTLLLAAVALIGSIILKGS